MPHKPMPRRITLELVPHGSQRYNTVGDWYMDPTDPYHLIIKGSEFPAGWWQWAVPLHELAEALTCLALGVEPESVDAFDMAFEDDPKRSTKYDEPGDDPRAPYHNQHQFAHKIERQFLETMLHGDWDKYERGLERLYNKRQASKKTPSPKGDK